MPNPLKVARLHAAVEVARMLIQHDEALRKLASDERIAEKEVAAELEKARLAVDSASHVEAQRSYGLTRVEKWKGTFAIAVAVVSLLSSVFLDRCGTHSHASRASDRYDRDARMARRAFPLS